MLNNEKFRLLLSVDLIEPDAKPWTSVSPYVKIFQQKTFKDSTPWIIVSVYQMSILPINSW